MHVFSLSFDQDVQGDMPSNCHVEPSNASNKQISSNVNIGWITCQYLPFCAQTSQNRALINETTSSLRGTGRTAYQEPAIFQCGILRLDGASILRHQKNSLPLQSNPLEQIWKILVESM